MNKINIILYRLVALLAIFFGVMMNISIILIAGVLMLVVFDVYEEPKPKPKPHICKYCGAETTQPDNECYANNPPPQETL